MGMAGNSQPSRTPLGDATARVVNTPSARPSKSIHAYASEPNPLRAHPVTVSPQQQSPATPGFISKRNQKRGLSSKRAPPAITISPAVQPPTQDTKKDTSSGSQDSNAKRQKTHVGPWKLGKSLGKGSAAQVRLVEHKFTHQLAAVKILSRDIHKNTQPGSIAELDIWDRSRKEYETEKRMPFTIEREIAIMKLINHPNIVQLFDIWENQSEIYLVLEYVECGDFYTYLDRRGRLPEQEGIYFLRQLVSALEYVHSFNICHRDLKPENILVTKDRQLKITDFGMSALHQSPHHLLKTSCGSPHYAAPELVRPGAWRGYRGDKADVWSLGVIFYAAVLHALPFNDPDVPKLLKLVEKSDYDIPEWVTPEMESLITYLLEPEPEKRPVAAEIWEHPLVRKYDYLDDYNKGDRAHARSNARYDPVPASQLDPQTLRQLKSVWHTYSEQQLASSLTSQEHNEFKMFYWLLHDYREKRLENYGTDLTFSDGDFHHLQPPNWRKKYTTVEFAAEGGRSPSRFTVISNVATDEDGVTLKRADTEGKNTVKSYDPYRSSLNMDSIVASQAKVTIHRNGTSSSRGSKAASARTASARTSKSNQSRRSKGSRHMNNPSARRNSRHSLKSIVSGEEISYQRPAPVPKTKRGVEFLHAQKRAADQGQGSCRPTSIAGDDAIRSRHVSCPESPTKKAGLSRNSTKDRPGTQSLADVSQINMDSPSWLDDLHDFSSSIAKDCDDAFNSTDLDGPNSMLVGPPSPTTTLTIHGAGNVNINVEPYDMRSPPRVSSAENFVTHDYIASRGRADRFYGYTPGSSTQPSSYSRYGSCLEKDGKRRIVTDPLYSADISFLPSINEASGEDIGKPRVVSAPEPSVRQFLPEDDGEDLECLASHRDTIRMVYTPSHQDSEIGTTSTAATKSKAQVRPGLPPRQQVLSDGIGTSIRSESSGKSSIATTKKKLSWFKRGSKDKGTLLEGFNQYDAEICRTDSSSSADKVSSPPKKKSFGLAWLRGSKDQRQLRLSLAGPGYDNSTPDERTRTFSNLTQPSYGKTEDDKIATRNIEPQQSWLARLFRVKPETRYLCFSQSQRHTRQELSILLKQWRRYGMRDVVVDRERNLVFARVGKKNRKYFKSFGTQENIGADERLMVFAAELRLKEASFAAEIMAVIEHGNRNPLCIVRLTQERGAASTFNRIVDTMEDVFRSRDMLVADKYKAKMMIKTLNS
ncbi:Pkinase-domain-containing protein [Rostrohypoxylon terebratum]|nr:Pkinase-domain-containing protein [Rostrohypoxylon terebratum]